MAVPKNVSTVLAPRDQSWSNPELRHFTDKTWAELTEAQKRSIAGHFAWAAAEVPSSFSDLRYAHHDPSTGQVVHRAVSAALAGTIEDAEVRAHLEAHLAEFDNEKKEGSRLFETRMSKGELRLDPETKQLTGYAIVFNKLSEDLGWMREMIDPIAVDRPLREGQDVRALINHDSNLILGRTKAGTLRMKKDSYGLKVTIDPPKTSAAKDIIESVRRGDVTGMSFAFSALEEAWDLKQDPPVRTVRDMNMYDVSIVTYPAYPQTDIALRSLNQARAQAAAPDLALTARYLKLKGIR